MSRTAGVPASRSAALQLMKLVVWILGLAWLAAIIWILSGGWVSTVFGDLSLFG